MTASTLAQETYLPAAAADVSRVREFMTACEAVDSESSTPRCFLTGSGAGDQVGLPPELYRVLRKVVDTMRAGLAVDVTPVSQKLTTQQAADLLGVSRPTVVKLLTEGHMPFEQVGTHRRLLLRDVLAFREQRRQAQYAALEVTSVDLDDEADLKSTLASLREARRAVARRRRNAS